MTLVDGQTVTAVRHWNANLFSFRVSRPASLRFRSGEFVMIGLPDDAGKPILRAYSIASPAWDDELEFYSIKVANGPLTSRLQHIVPGDAIILRPKPVGTLVHEALRPGRRLWLLSTGTGFAPFASLLRDVETWERYEEVVVLHTCRESSELSYGRTIIDSLPETPLVGEMVAAGKLHYHGTTTREVSAHMGRITDNLASGHIYAALGIAALDPAQDRLMICGSYAFNVAMKGLLEGLGFQEGSNASPASFVIEKAFVGDGV